MSENRSSVSQRKFAPRVVAAIAMLAASTGLPVATQAQTPAGDIAAQIRQQGHRCDEPATVTQDARRSKPDSAVWVLKCHNATYRVRLVPDMAAHVVRLGRH